MTGSFRMGTRGIAAASSVRTYLGDRGVPVSWEHARGMAGTDGLKVVLAPPKRDYNRLGLGR
jgi:hypothetical protein